MELNLNQEKEYIQIDDYKIPFFREFRGSNLNIFSNLIKSGRIPMNISQLMQRKLDVRNADAEVKEAWIDSYFTSGDAIVFHPEGHIIIDLDSQVLRGLNEESPRKYRLRKSDKEKEEAFENYAQLLKTKNGVLFKKGKLGKINQDLSRKEAKSHPILKVLARNQDLLNDFVDFVYSEYQLRFAPNISLADLRIMAVKYNNHYIKDLNAPEINALCMNNILTREVLHYAYLLDGGLFNLVGLAPEVLSAPYKGLSPIQRYNMADLQAVDAAIKGLEGILTSAVLKPFVDLRKKL